MTTGNKQQRGNIEVKLDLLPGALKDSGYCWRTTVKTTHQQGQGLCVMGRNEAVSEANASSAELSRRFCTKAKEQGKVGGRSEL